MSEVEIALNHWHNRKKKASPLDKKNKLDLLKIEAVSIVKVFLPRIDPTKKLADHFSKGPCVEWVTSFETIATITGLAPSSSYTMNADSVNSNFLKLYFFGFIL